MEKMSMEEAEKVITGYDRGAITLEEASEILKGGVKPEKGKKKPTGPTSTFTKLNARIEELDQRLSLLTEDEDAEDEEKPQGDGVSLAEAEKLLGA